MRIVLVVNNGLAIRARSKLYGRETLELGNFKAVDQFEAKF